MLRAGRLAAISLPLPASVDLADPAAEFATVLADLDSDLARLTSVAFSIRGTANNFIDELRIGTASADVVPEPAMPALLSIGLAALALRCSTTRRSIR
jgi:hypothetical protein